MSEITYARAGNPGEPADFWRYAAFDLDTGQKIDHVVECNTVEGWLIQAVFKDGRLVVDDDWNVCRQRVEGRFELRKIDDTPSPGAQRE